MILKYIPNILTLLRLVLIIPFLIFLYQKAYVYAFYTFVFAGLSDGLDGWLARYFNWQSFFGSFADPLADKLLVATSFISLAFIGALPWWLVSLVFLRDFTISMGVVAWYWFIRQKINFEPTLLSKFNTILQLGLVVFCLFELAYNQFHYYVINTLIAITAVTTTTSFIDYLWAWGTKAALVKETP
ncbi:MAG: CDP-alcohol phosphatidyltransferase family protein [Legionella sp.]|nr:CDP-alcohol phosphatidyltransferase family protein [Legionella sp.]